MNPTWPQSHERVFLYEHTVTEREFCVILSLDALNVTMRHPAYSLKK